MDLIWKTGVAGRLAAFSLALAVNVVGASLQAGYAPPRDPVLRSEQTYDAVDRTNKGDRLKDVPAHEAMQTIRGKRMELRHGISKLAAAEAIPATGMHEEDCMCQTRLVRT